jgi:amino acid adenylation domain-containing protein
VEEAMIVPAGSQRQYWTEQLGQAGMTALPRWSDGQDGVFAEYVEQIPTPLSIGQVLAAHAVVLAAVTGEPETTTGYVPEPGGRPLPMRLPGTTESWHDLAVRANRTEAWVRACAEQPVEEIAASLGRTGPLFEVELDLYGAGVAPAPSTVLRVAMPYGTGRLHLQYRTDVLDAGAAARIASYYVAALNQMIAEPGAKPRSLLSPREYAFQMHDLAGPTRPIPTERFHELFEQRVAAHPDAVAAEHAGTQWTYAELDARANQLARALLARGLQREGVVAVVAERTLDWMASVIAIFKAGGVYLPIEPHFPAERVARTLARAECRLALTEPGSDGGLPADVQAVFFTDAYAEGHDDRDLGIRVAGGQLAYIYFTSGSTGEPKGAMCEHAGMVNHLLAKIEDLGIAEGAVVAQTAPQCFDISLWQLLAALLVGGRTHLVPQEVILDVERFVDEITEHRVAVVQLVPSYLEVVATYLEQNARELPDLRVVSATGEALKVEIVQRWFAVAPGIPLVNAYGLTETSDDTNHEVLREVPASGRISLGRPVRNVRVYVVDANLDPVPLGAPGLIAFSGVCVGRGYVNDQVRTEQCYLADPHRPGQRLYLGGDYGRWLPDGKLEFLGRRDSQVKIRGFRIEIGEIDNALLLVPGVRDGAVVVAGSENAKQLVAFYAADAPIDTDVLTSAVAAKLPEYMVPAAFHHRASMPLTPNGKIDTKALRKLAADLADGGGAPAAPSTPTEEMLAAAFATVLDVPVERIGRLDNFFDRGGSSLMAVKLAIATGRVVSLKDITRTPVLADLAAHIDNG